MTDAGRDALVLLLLAGAAVLSVRALARAGPPPALGPPHAQAPCPVPVEREGDGVRCADAQTAANVGLAAGERLRLDGLRGRMAPARLELFEVPLDVNTASTEELQSLEGIGPGLAARIAGARPFATVDEVRSVPGLGGRRFEALRPRLFVGADASAPVPDGGSGL